MDKPVDKAETRLDAQAIAEHLLWVLRVERAINLAVHKAQEENRRLGSPNYYVINGRIVSDRSDND